MSPRVTIVMPVRNARPYVEMAVSSVLCQTFEDFELVVIDDGSTDGSGELLERKAARDERVRLIRREARGLVATLNEGLGRARAPLVARMDADDLMLRDRLALQLEHLEARPDCVCVGGWAELVDERGRPLWTVRTPRDHSAIDAAHLEGHTSIIHPTAMMRTELAQRLGYREAFVLAEDLDLWLRLAEVGTLHNLPTAVLAYRRHSRSLSASRGEEQMRAMRRACESAYARRGIDGRFTLSEHWHPTRDRASRRRFMVDTGWTAFMSGNRRTAAVYGGKSLATDPFDPSGWKLLLCALFKKAPARRGNGERTCPATASSPSASMATR